MEYKNVLITDYDHFGRGIGKIDGKVIFVKNGIVGEIVDIKVIKEKKTFLEAEITKIIKKSSDRREVKCPYYDICGGCNLMHLEYDNQVLFKKNKVINIFKQYLNIDIFPDIIWSNKEYNYRNKITLHYKNKKLGFYNEKSNDVFKLDKCLIAEERLNEYIKKVKSNKKDIIIRTNGEEVTNSLIMNIGDYKFIVDESSFFQVNNYICNELFNLLESEIEEDDIILDLYSGVSSLSVVAAAKCKKVTAIENNKSCVKNALENKKINNIDNLEIIHSKVEDEIKNLKNKYTKIIVDPPRRGLDKKTRLFLNDSKSSKIFYISCNPITLARDIKELDNYKLSNIVLLDMFPNTYHVECVSVLHRKNIEK